MKRWIIFVVAIAFLAGMVGCSKIETFYVAFGDRLPADHDIDCFMNGILLGTAYAGNTQKFKVETRRLDGPTNPQIGQRLRMLFFRRATGRQENFPVNSPAPFIPIGQSMWKSTHGISISTKPWSNASGFLLHLFGRRDT